MQHTRLRPFTQGDLAALIPFWNDAFADQPNFYPIDEETFQRRVLDASATDTAGLILAWQADEAGHEQLVGLVHALRPPPATGLYRNWTLNHTIAVLYVAPAFRKQGIGSRLLQAAESWLYYCPVHVAGHAQPVYGAVEGPRQPFFGSTERMGVRATEGTLIDFLSRHGYLSVEIGDVSLERQGAPPPLPVWPQELSSAGLRPISFSHHDPFDGEEASKLPTVSQWGDNGGDPYSGIGLIDADGILQGQIAWYPMHAAGKMALINYRVDPSWRRRGAGSYLLDRGLHEMMNSTDRAGQPIHTVALHTHLTLCADAMKLYLNRGFEVVDVWVNLVKT